MRVMKFGGSSVGTPARVNNVIGIIRRARAGRRRIVAVFSAFQGVTDQLIATSRMAAAGDSRYHAHFRALKKRHMGALTELVPVSRRRQGAEKIETYFAELSNVLHGVFYTREVTARMLDYIMSFGELLSSSIIAESMRARGISCSFVDSRLLIKTDDSFGMARVKYDLTYHNIRSYCRKHRELLIACGFIASTTDNDTTTLGRGGSDFSAALYGAALEAEEIEIWTDVDGVNTADPRKVKQAFPITTMTYDEAMEMSHFGAKVIHPPTMQPALDRDIPIRIKNTFNPEFPGTKIARRSPRGKYPIKGISSIDDVALLRIQGSGLVGTAGIGRRVFKALAAREINVLMVSQASSEYSLCLAVAPHDAEAARRLIGEELRLEIRDRQVQEVVVERNLSVVAIVGENMRKTTGISGRLFQSLGSSGINVVAIAQGSSELNISTIVARADEERALNTIHAAFFDAGTRVLNLFLAGTGVVGGRLLEQIAAQRDGLLRTHKIDIRVQAIANKRQMVFDDRGTLPFHWRDRLADQGLTMEPEAFFQRMKQLPLQSKVFVDCTASDDPVARYERILSSRISVVASNKRANAGNQSLYDRLHAAALSNGVRFLYETNVGAGLPVIRTIHDLRAGGDRIHRIDGVLSGTLSYLLNSLTDGRLFSAVVREARERGYTEPDPREDLRGLDVGRKLLILAREAGERLEFRDVRIESLVPPAMLRSASVAAFMKRLREMDAEYVRRRESAATRGKKLSYIASLAGGKASAGLREVGPDHPAFALQGSEVVVVLTTAFCGEHPIVIRGPGAGAEVTATGVLADIVHIAREQ